MTDQQVLIYRQWLYEGTARRVPIPERQGWQWLEVHQGARGWVRCRTLGPNDVLRLRREET